MQVLVLDDEAQVLELCRRGIEGGPFKVTTAASGNQAVEILSRGRFDILLADIHMDPPGGLDITQLVRERYPHMDVIIMTAYPTMDTVIRALKLGAYDYLTKPLDLMLIKAALRRCLEKRSLEAKLALAERWAGQLASAAREFGERLKHPAHGAQIKESDEEHEACRGFAEKVFRDLEGLRADLGPESPRPQKAA